MAEYRVQCPGCGATYRIQPTAFGKTVTCQKCQTQFTPSGSGAQAEGGGGEADSEPARSTAAKAFSVLGKLALLGGLGLIGYIQVPHKLESKRLDVARAEAAEDAASEKAVKADLEKKKHGIDERDHAMEAGSRRRFEMRSLGVGVVLVGLLLVAFSGTRAERFAAIIAIAGVAA